MAAEKYSLPQTGVEGAVLPAEAQEPAELKCPVCDSEALYRYGHTRQGKKRFQCIVCGRQFAVNPSRARIRYRPNCPKCGRLMHAYKRESDTLRFRCSGYPRCRTYIKLPLDYAGEPDTP